MKIDNFFKDNIFSSFDDFEEKLINLNCENKRTGDIFEQFIKIYLVLSKNKFQIENEKDIYLFDEIPDDIHSKCNLADRDMGVDGYFKSNNKEILFQCKFSKDRKKVNWKKLSTFIGEAYKADVKYVFTNGEDISEILQKHNVQKILYNDLANLDEIFFLNLNKFINDEKLITKLHDRRDHQKQAIRNIINGFDKNNRGKYISACGSGKTLTALWLIEDLKIKNVLVLVPNLALIKQTVDEWSNQKSDNFKYLCVCSDKSADNDSIQNDDEFDIENDEFYIPPTTNPSEISQFVQYETNERKIIFCTYQSLDKIHKAILNKGIEFDLIIFDEAHRTAGVDNSLFSNGLYDDYIKSKKRLFMTATERILMPRVKALATNKNKSFSDMGDQKLYGPIFSELTFGDAIALGIITDYDIIVSDIQTDEYKKLINENDLVKYDEKNNKEVLDRINNLFLRLFFEKAIKKFKLKKTFIFHNKIQNSEDFVNNLKKNTNNKDIYIQHIDGKTKSLKRKRIFSSFDKPDRIAAISNAKCLTEGVDVPSVDGVLFANPKKSIIEIIQAAGRSMRKDRNNPEKKAKIIIPIISSNDQSINNFEILTNTVQAMREIDNRFAELIDKFHYETSTGRGGGGIDDFPIIYDAKELNLDKFKYNIKTNIYNRNSVDDRFSNHSKATNLRTNVKVLYSVKVYKYKGLENLINKTKDKFTSKNAIMNRSEITNDHNNVNHSKWIGLIEETDRKFKLTQNGKRYFDNIIDFKTLLREGIFKKDNIKDYPYLAILKILSKTQKINFLQYLYGICLMESSNDSEINICVNNINHTQYYDYINLKKNKKNAEKVLQSLNRKFDIDFNYVDVFETNKHKNYFTYAADHIEKTCSDFIKYDRSKMELEVINLNNLKFFIENK